MVDILLVLLLLLFCCAVRFGITYFEMLIFKFEASYASSIALISSVRQGLLIIEQPNALIDP